MNLDDELKRLGLLADAEQAFSARLDEIENDPKPRLTRLTSHEPKEGYYFDVLWQLYFEGDALFRERIKSYYRVTPIVGI